MEIANQIRRDLSHPHVDEHLRLLMYQHHFCLPDLTLWFVK